MCRLDMESGPDAVEFLRVLMVSVIMIVVNGGRGLRSSLSFLSCFFVFLLSGCVGLREILA